MGDTKIENGITLEKLMEIVSNDKRVHLTLRLSKTVLEFLKEVIKEGEIVDADGKPYSVRYFIEDMILWVIGDGKRFEQFLNDMYEVEEYEEEEEKEE